MRKRLARGSAVRALLSAVFPAASTNGQRPKATALSTKVSLVEIEMRHYCSECGSRLVYEEFCEICGLSF